jgi:cytochrome c oxidase assembly factor CtaG
MFVLALLANICYSVAYLAEIPIQQLAPRELWNRLRWAVWLLGMLAALVLENYWIADGIYPGTR